MTKQLPSIKFVDISLYEDQIACTARFRDRYFNMRNERDERQKLLEKVFGENCPNCTFCQKVYGVLSCVFVPREWEPIPDEGRLPKCPFNPFVREDKSDVRLQAEGGDST